MTRPTSSGSMTCQPARPKEPANHRCNPASIMRHPYPQMTDESNGSYLTANDANDLVRVLLPEMTTTRAGSDLLYGIVLSNRIDGLGGDTVSEGARNDTVSGNRGSNEVHGDEGDDCLRGGLDVEDHADALLQVVEKDALGRGYNIGGENERGNLELARSICTILDRLRPRNGGASCRDLITFATDRPGHDARHEIDPTRMREEPGWHPSVTLGEGLDRIVYLYLGNEDRWRPPLGRKGLCQRLGASA